MEFEPGNPDKNAEVFFALASSDHDEHLKNMEQLALMLLKPGIVDELTAVENEEDLVRLDELLEDI